MAAAHWQRLISDLQFYTTRLLNFQFDMYSLGWQPVIQPILASNTVKTCGQKKEHLANVLGLQQQERELMISMVMSEITCFSTAYVENIFRTLRFHLTVALHKITWRIKANEQKNWSRHSIEQSRHCWEGPLVPPHRARIPGWKLAVEAAAPCDAVLCSWVFQCFLFFLTLSNVICLWRWI